MLDSYYLTLSEFSSKYPTFTLGSLKALVFYSRTNGFERVIRRFSPTGKRGRILINVKEFFAWLDENNKENNNG